MTTVVEIESAVEHLPREDVEVLAGWLSEYHASLSASAEMFSYYDAEESDPESQWIGDP